MGQFFKFLFASCLGVFLALILMSVIGGLAIGGLVSSATNTTKKVPSNAVLKLSLSDPIPDRTNNMEMSFTDWDKDKILGLYDVVAAIQQAEKDDRIEGIYLELEGPSTTGFASAAVLHEALEHFRDSGKFIVAYSDSYAQSSYFLASTADEVLINPLGGVDLRGFAAQIPFFKNMLDKIGVKMQVYYAGQYKSATEPYRLTEMSAQNRKQIREFIVPMYDYLIDEIADSRNLTSEKLNNTVNTYAGRKAESALAAGLVDRIAYKDEAMDILRNRLGYSEEDKIKWIGLTDYFNANPPDKDYSVKDKVAVIYAEGNIVDGKGSPGSIGDDYYTKEIAKIRKRKDTKAIVLRVNSPGGSAMASENIWRELSLAKADGIPVVVSMGDYAASGGYYISAMADQIYAEANTLTGSIGVFSLIPSAEKLLQEKIGIGFDTVLTAEYSTGLTVVRDLSANEGQLMQQSADEVYETFLARVADGRNMTRDEVHAVAQGRVWIGAKAKEIGLVDEVGGLEDAIAAAADLAGLPKYRVVAYPKVKEPLQQLMEEFTKEEEDLKSSMLKKEMGDWYPYLEFFQDIKKGQGVQAKLPFLLELN